MAKKAIVAKSRDEMKAMLAARMKEKEDIIEGGGGRFISTKGKRFTYQGAELEAPLNVVILGYVQDKTYYDRKWSSEETYPPACFAVGFFKENELVPDEESPSPQADSCSQCEHNQWDDAGTPKECRDQWRLAVIPAECEDPAAEEIAFIRISPTGYGRFKKLVRSAKVQYGLPLLACITSIDFVDEDYPSLEFQLVEEIEDEEFLQATIEREDEAMAELSEHGYNVEDYEAPTVKRRASKKKVTAKKKVSSRKKR